MDAVGEAVFGDEAAIGFEVAVAGEGGGPGPVGDGGEGFEEFGDAFPRADAAEEDDVGGGGAGSGGGGGDTVIEDVDAVGGQVHAVGDPVGPELAEDDHAGGAAEHGADGALQPGREGVVELVVAAAVEVDDEGDAEEAGEGGYDDFAKRAAVFGEVGVDEA